MLSPTGEVSGQPPPPCPRTTTRTRASSPRHQPPASSCLSNSTRTSGILLPTTSHQHPTRGPNTLQPVVTTSFRTFEKFFVPDYVVIRVKIFVICKDNFNAKINTFILRPNLVFSFILQHILCPAYQVQV